VQVFTRSADAAPGGEVSATLGSLGSLAADALLRTKVGEWRLTSTAAAGRSDGFRDHSGDRHASLDASASHALSGGQLRLAASAQWRGRDEPGPLRLTDLPAGRAISDPAFAFDHEEIRRQRLALSWRRESERALALVTLQGSARDSRFLRTLLIAADLPDRSLRHVRTLAFAASAEGERRFDIAGQPLSLRAGAEAGREGLETDYFGVDSNGAPGELLATDDPRRHRFALFAVQDLTVFGHARLAFGARHDEIRDETTASETRSGATSPHVALSIRLGHRPEPTTVFVRWSRAFKAATLDQLFDPRPFPDFQGGSFLISNPKLSPQRATALEAGVGRKGRSWRVEAVAYRIDVKDEIDFDPATFRYTNIGRSRHQGLEIAGAAFEGGSLALRVDYGFNRTEPRGTPGHQLKNIPRHTARAGATARLPGRLSASLHGSLVSRRFLDDGNLIPLSSYVTFGGRLARSFGRFEARLDVLNLLGEDFEEVGYVLPDFSGGAVPYAFPGHPRMIRFQFRSRF
jgi:outer membrane receptor protein involved in Fe transport